MAQRFLIGLVHRARAKVAQDIGAVAYVHDPEAPVKRPARDRAATLYATQADFAGNRPHPVPDTRGFAHDRTHSGMDFLQGEFPVPQDDTPVAPPLQGHTS